MASIRRAAAPLFSRAICRQCDKPLVRPAFAAPATCSRPYLRVSTPRIAITPRRWHSAPASNSKVYDFEQVKQLTSSPSEERVLIDVREPHEYKEGYIPTAINVPIKSQPDALFLPADEFEDRFGFSKPPADKEVVFYCRSGVRSSAAANLAQQIGYTNVAEYRGSWLDWQEKGGAASKP